MTVTAVSLVIAPALKGATALLLRRSAPFLYLNTCNSFCVSINTYSSYSANCVELLNSI